MADKKTSQETSGAPIQKGDEWRIARSGSNYKLTSEQIFSETLTLGAFQTLASGSNLIPGRWYKVTGVNPIGATVLVQAATTTNWSTSAIWIDSVRGFYWGCTVDDLSATITSVTNDHGTTWFDFDTSTPSVLDDLWSGNQISQSITLANGGGTLTDCVVKNSLVQINSSIFTNCIFDNVTIINTDNSSHVITNCHFKDCTIVLTQSVTMNTCVIIGVDRGGTPSTYNFDAQNITDGKIVTGEYSTFYQSLDLSDPGTYDGSIKTLYLPVKNKHIGKYYLNSFVSGTDIQYIVGSENDSYTPVIFQHNGADGDVLNFIHQNSKSAIGADEILLSSHHGSNDHLDTLGSYFTTKREPNAFWYGIQVTNFNA